MTRYLAGPPLSAARLVARVLPMSVLLAAVAGCRSVETHRRAAELAAERSIATTQQRALGRAEPVEVSSAADTLRRRLLLDGNLPYRGPASLGTRDLPGTNNWEGLKHLGPPAATGDTNTAALLDLGLMDALQLSAHNSREYQDAKEALFRSALNLDLESREFRASVAGALSGKVERTGPGDDPVESVVETGEAGVSRKLLTGTTFAGAMAVDLVKLLTQEAGSALGLSADASISIPLLRGAGRDIAGASLRQAEQDLLYQVHVFERFKRILAVQVADDYLAVLRERQQVRNAEENYRRLIAAARRSRRLADAGRLPEFQYDQAVQDELRARTRWVDAQQGYAARLDAFKVALGLPPDAKMGLDQSELDRLALLGDQIAGAVSRPSREAAVPPADAPIELREPGREGGGPLEIDADRATRLALDHRLDLRTAQGRVDDAQRDVLVAADALRGEVTLFGRAELGSRRTSAASVSSGDSRLDFGDGAFSGLLTIDLPFERTAERVAYRARLIDLERVVRDFQELEDRIKLEVRGTLRDLLGAREGLQVQRLAVELAEKRVRSTDMLLQAGRAQVRDLLESQEALLNAQNALISAVVSYRIAELSLQRDLGLLMVGPDGLWTEYRPEEESE